MCVFHLHPSALLLYVNAFYNTSPVIKCIEITFEVQYCLSLSYLCNPRALYKCLKPVKSLVSGNFKMLIIDSFAL